MYTINRDPSGSVLGITRQSDGAQIPLDPANRDYQDFLTWNAQQATPDDLQTHTPPGWPGWEAYRDSQEPDLATLRNQAAQAITDITTYLASADTATAAQVRAEVKAIDQRQRAILRALVRLVRMALPG